MDQGQNTIALRKTRFLTCLAMLQALHEAGADILLGTDALNPYHLPGYAVHEELGYLVRAGLSPYEALRAGTHDAALALGKLEEFGAVAAGKRADLLLVNGDPLADMSNAGRIRGAMMRGRWLAAEELQSMLDGLAQSFEPTLLERILPLSLIGAAVYLLSRTRRIGIAGGALEGSLEVFFGGLHWQALAYAVWEQVMCMAMIVALLVLFRNRLNRQGNLARSLSGDAYAGYIVHAPVIVLLALVLSSIEIEMGIKFILVAPVTVVLSFAVGHLVRSLPLARDIL